MTPTNIDPRTIIRKMGLKLPTDTFELFDRTWQGLGYKDRSEAVRVALDRFLDLPDVLTNPARIGRFRLPPSDSPIIEKTVYIRYDQELAVERIARMVGTSKRAVVRAAIEYFIKEVSQA